MDARSSARPEHRLSPVVHGLATPRLALTPLRNEDADELHVLWTAPGVRRYLWDDEVIPPEQTAEIVRRSSTLYAEGRLGLWGARLRDSAAATGAARLAGFAGYWYFRDPPELELLYGVSEELWGRGLATELAQVMVGFGKDPLGFAAIRASTDVGNVASARVLEKVGFALERREVVAGLDTVFYVLERPAG